MKNYCMSSYLSFRTIFEENKTFLPNRKNMLYKSIMPDRPCYSAQDIALNIQQYIKENYIPNKTAIFLSGGMDSAVIASFLPKGTKAYTFKCMIDGAIDETKQAKRYADYYDLDHEVIEITWDDFLELTPKLMEYSGMPIHSIEVLIYKGCLTAKKNGIERIFLGNCADSVFGGFDGLLSKDWSYQEFIDRYTFLDPKKVLKHPVSVEHIFAPYKTTKNSFDAIKFIQEIYSIESISSYMHAFDLAGLTMIDPFIQMYMGQELDLQRVRNGESKYLIRELFMMRYSDISIVNKIPMPRAMDQWLANWKGPTRKEFLPNCLEGLTGDQKWQLYCLEWFLSLYE